MTGKQIIETLATFCYLIACLLIGSLSWQIGLAMFFLYMYKNLDRIANG